MTTDRPLAAPFRCRGPYGWIMIGAKDDADALRQAPGCTRDGLEFWTGERYAPVPPRDYYVTMRRAKRTAFLLRERCVPVELDGHAARRVSSQSQV